MFNKKLKEKISDLERELDWTKCSNKCLKESLENLEQLHEKRDLFCANCKNGISVSINKTRSYSGYFSLNHIPPPPPIMNTTITWACALESPCDKFKRKEFPALAGCYEGMVEP